MAGKDDINRKEKLRKGFLHGSQAQVTGTPGKEGPASTGQGSQRAGWEGRGCSPRGRRAEHTQPTGHREDSGFHCNKGS